MSSRVAFVAGGSSGIGLATAQKLLEDGHSVVIAGRSRERLDAAAHVLGPGAGHLGVELDVTSDQSCAEAIGAALEAHDRIDILVNCVGSAPSGGFDVVPADDWRRSFDGKVLGSVRLMSLAVPSMRENGWGRIVNVAGTAGVEPDPWMVVAGAMNAALVTVTKAASRQLGGEGITVNAVLPGPTRTGRWESLVGAHARRTGLSEDLARADLESRIPDGRPADPREIADYVGFLTSDGAGHINGTALAIDGGETRSI